MKRCYKCGEPWEGVGSPAFKAVCEKCFAYLHCCKNCRLHDPSAHNGCVSMTTESVPDSVGQNFCEEFEFVDRNDRPQGPQQQGGHKKWNDLFGGR